MVVYIKFKIDELLEMHSVPDRGEGRRTVRKRRVKKRNKASLRLDSRDLILINDLDFIRMAMRKGRYPGNKVFRNYFKRGSRQRKKISSICKAQMRTARIGDVQRCSADWPNKFYRDTKKMAQMTGELIISNRIR